MISYLSHANKDMVTLKNQNMKQSSIIIILVIVILVLAGAFWLWQKGTQTDGITPTPPTPVEPTEPTEPRTPQEPDSVQIPEGWKTFEINMYSISYPDDWELVGPLVNTEIFEEDRTEETDIILYSPLRYTALEIGLGGRPAGAVIPVRVEQTPLEVWIGDTKYKTIEIRAFLQSNFTTIDDPNPPQPIYLDKPGIWFTVLGGYHKYKGKYPFVFTFGNEYPSLGRSSQKPNSLEVYEKEKKIALEILKTFKLKTE